MSHSDGVAVCIVTHNAADDLPGCLESVAALDPPPREVVIVDCASSDGSAELAEHEAARVGLGPGEATQPPGQVEAPQSLGPEETAQPASGQTRRFGDHYDVPPMKVTVERSESNLGFAGGMNRAIALSTAPFVLSLNADARPEPDYCRRLLAACGAPLLIMRGQHSRILSAGSAAHSASLGGGRVVEIPDAGHNVSLETPKAVADALHHFLAPLPPPK